MQNSDRYLKGIICDDNKISRWHLKEQLSKQLNVELEDFGDGISVLRRLNEISAINHHIDFITTDITRPGMDGFELMKKIRELPEEMLYSNGLRLRHIPIIVISAWCDVKAINAIDKDIKYTNKPHNPLMEIVNSIASYRRKVTDDFINKGFAIQFEEGKYVVSEAFEMPPFIDTKYFQGISNKASQAITRLILVQSSTAVAKASIVMFEDLINRNSTSEKELHEFIRLYPEFLLDNNFDILYSENSFKNNRRKYRTDLLAQPRGLRNDGDKWTIVELKKHTEKILTNKKYHSNFTKAVYNGITQLKNYQEYFSDLSNENEIRKKFNGVLPNPKLCLIIGQTPKEKSNLFSKMKNQFPEINIITYDEVLNFRKIKIQYLESLGL